MDVIINQPSLIMMQTISWCWQSYTGIYLYG